MVRKHIVFHGEVQGVGFRYHATTAARMYGCTGWVKNEHDGTVSMEIQGDEAAIDMVIQTLHRGTYIGIDSMDIDTLSVVDTESDFRVRML